MIGLKSYKGKKTTVTDTHGNQWGCDKLILRNYSGNKLRD